ncbi:MAG: hypothetical protein GY784_06500 [Gammaproteobacteria bacterium]|nr:hypothetical protein [Gammaproteobacteria bacterium]
MSDFIEPSSAARKPNPLIWIIIAVAGLIAYIFLGTDRGLSTSIGQVESGQAESGQAVIEQEKTGKIVRYALIPPGMRARQLIKQARSAELPYPLESLFNEAIEFQREGSLADAHLLFFFSAREGYLPAMMKMAELSDPTLFRSNNSLLDQADAIQAYKWYQRLAERGQPDANGRIQNLHKWANKEAEAGNPYARQLLLVIQ